MERINYSYNFYYRSTGHELVKMTNGGATVNLKFCEILMRY